MTTKQSLAFVIRMVFKCKVLKECVLKPFKPSSFILHSSKHVLDNFYEFWHGQESLESYSKSRWVANLLFLPYLLIISQARDTAGQGLTYMIYNRES